MSDPIDNTPVYSDQSDHSPLSNSSPEAGPDSPTALDSAKYNKSYQPTGFSLLVRGEPGIWLTGGMLVICMAMMVGLLVVVLYNGLANFWPAPLKLAAARDGGLTLGEQSGTSQFIFTKQSLDTLQPAARIHAESLLQGRNSKSLERIYLRTGNFELTNRHYSYISDVDSDLSTLVEPTNAWVVERSERGRFYGFPLQWREHFGSPRDEELVREQELLAFIRQNLPIDTVRDSVSEDSVSENDSESPPLNGSPSRTDYDLVAALESTITERQTRHLQTWIENKRGETGLVFIGKNGEWQSLADFEEEKDRGESQDVSKSSFAADSEYIYVESGTDSVDAAIRRASDTISGLQAEREELRERISSADRSIESKRLAVRDAEIQLDKELPQSLESYSSPSVALALTRERFEQLRASLNHFGDQLLSSNSEWSDALNVIQSRLDEFVEAEISGLQSSVDATQNDLDSLPPVLGTAIANYIDARVRAVTLQDLASVELDQVERALERYEIEFVTSGTRDASDQNRDLAFNVLGIVSEDDQPSANETVLSFEELQSIELGPKRNISLGLRREPGRLPTPTGLYIDQTTSGDGEDSQGSERRAVSELQEQTVLASHIVRRYEPAGLTIGDKSSIYLSRWWEFLSEPPREANTEGGFFPAIWGTIVMTLIMTLFVVPFGVMAALYLREYTKAGVLVSLIRICINNLAGVPSIVYGVFGLAFFCYVIGGYVDGGPEKAGVTPWPPATWFAALFAVVVCGLVSFLISVSFNSPEAKSSPMKQRIKRSAMFFWLACIAGVILLFAKTPFFEGFYRASFPNPTFGKGGLLWAALTLALLTLPVVIVATEEALSAVPNSLREGSYACGASKWQTIQRIILPHARPGILTGTILAMARGAGEVAPLMLVGALPTAIDLPLDTEFPFFHGSRSFMHLGFQIFSLGFQSQNSEAAKPMVYTSTLLLILIVALLNVVAIWLRSQLRKRFVSSQF